jgi:hypothetical protein
MTKLNEEARELSMNDLDQATGAVMGADDVVVGIVIGLVANAMSNVHGISDSINYIKQQAGR